MFVPFAFMSYPWRTLYSSAFVPLLKFSPPDVLRAKPLDLRLPRHRRGSCRGDSRRRRSMTCVAPTMTGKHGRLVAPQDNTAHVLWNAPPLKSFCSDVGAFVVCGGVSVNHAQAFAYMFLSGRVSST